jgi:hypothetical protein
MVSLVSSGAPPLALFADASTKTTVSPAFIDAVSTPAANTLAIFNPMTFPILFGNRVHVTRGFS